MDGSTDLGRHGAGVQATPRDDPRARGRGLAAAKDTDFAGEQETEGVHGVPDPRDVGDDGNALPAQEMLHPDEEVLPNGAGLHARELRRDFVVKPNLVVPLQGRRHRGHQHIVIILAGHAALTSDCDDI